MASFRVLVKLCGGCGFSIRESAVRAAFVRSGLPMSPDQLVLEHAKKIVRVDVERNGRATTVFHREGPSAYNTETPLEIVEAVRKVL